MQSQACAVLTFLSNDFFSSIKFPGAFQYQALAVVLDKHARYLAGPCLGASLKKE